MKGDNKYMKNLFKKFILPLILFTMFVTKVSAAGTVSASLTGSQTVTKGSVINVNVYVGTVTNTTGDGAVYAFSATVNFDSEYFEYQSLTVPDDWAPRFNKNNHKMILSNEGLDAGVKNGTIATIKLKAIKSGTSSVSLSGVEAADTAGDLDVTMGGAREITINEPAVVTPKSNNSKLSNLVVNGFTISPAFDSGVTSYTVEVPEDTTKVNIVATKDDTKATVTGDGETTLSTSGKLTTITIKVKAEDNSYTNYVVNVIKVANNVTPDPTPVVEKDGDSTLKKLDVSGYTLTPAFKSNVTSYQMKVTNNITGLSVTAIPNSDKAKVSITGNKNWVVGNNAILVTVTAENGTQTVYTVNVTRADKNQKSSDTNIDLRILVTHNIDPEYSNSINDFNVTVPNDVTELKLSVTPYDKKTKVVIEGGKDLQVGTINPVKITITAEDGTVRTVNLYVTRSEEKANTDLLDLRVARHTLNPVFKPSITEYKVNVNYDEDELELIIKTPEGAKAEVSGNENFKVGKNHVLIKVTDENGYVKYYEITVTKSGKKAFSFLGIGLIPFLLILLLLILLLLLLLYLLFRDKKDEEEVEVKQQDAPVNIDFKPEFNFNSKNGTDDDVIYSEGNLISGADVKQLSDGNKKEVYDPYDDVVTKDELVDAINESIETKNPEKLKMLLEQERLNRKKEELKRKEKLKEYEIDEEENE